MEPLFNALQKELIERHADAAEESNLGFEEGRLAMLHKEVRKEVEVMADFCKEYKPPKKKKN